MSLREDVEQHLATKSDIRLGYAGSDSPPFVVVRAAGASEVAIRGRFYSVSVWCCVTANTQDPQELTDKVADYLLESGIVIPGNIDPAIGQKPPGSKGTYDCLVIRAQATNY